MAMAMAMQLGWKFPGRLADKLRIESEAGAVLIRLVVDVAPHPWCNVWGTY